MCTETLKRSHRRENIACLKAVLEVGKKGSGFSQFVILHSFILKIVYKQVRRKIYLDAKMYS
jgi:hypothetical protein